MALNQIKIIVSNNQQSLRLDRFLTNYFLNVEKIETSRTKILSLIKNEFILVNNFVVKPNYIIKPNDVIICNKNINELINYNDTNNFTTPNKVDFKIIYEDEDIIVVNKPNNLVVHPSLSHANDTLVNGLLAYTNKLSDTNGNYRPGIVHRIDKCTTGLLVIAKTNFAHNFLARQLANHSIKRKYVAIVHGIIDENSAKIIAPIGRDPYHRLKMAVDKKGKPAITNLKVIKRFNNFTYISCQLETGRTHQIRVHLSYINHPILGDHLYGYNSDKLLSFGQFLHAEELELIHPFTNKIMCFKADAPNEFATMLKKIEED